LGWQTKAKKGYLRADVIDAGTENDMNYGKKEARYIGGEHLTLM
jgi:hypothetical protein